MPEIHKILAPIAAEVVGIDGTPYYRKGLTKVEHTTEGCSGLETLVDAFTAVFVLEAV